MVMTDATTAETASKATAVSVLLPVTAVSPNRTSGEHWSARKRRAAAQHATVRAMLHGHQPRLPCVVTMTRRAPSSGLDSHDNLRMSMKHVADSVAAWLGVPDKDPRVEWRYDQERGPYGVRLTIEPA
jgi:hypothetical protein